MFTQLATDVDDPIERLRAIHEVTKGAKEDHNALGANLLQDWAELAAPTTFALAARALLGHEPRRPPPADPQPGDLQRARPAVPALLRRRPARSTLPDGPGDGGRRPQHHRAELHGQRRRRLHGRRELVPDLWSLADHAQEAMAELLAAIEPQS